MTGAGVCICVKKNGRRANKNKFLEIRSKRIRICYTQKQSNQNNPNMMCTNKVDEPAYISVYKYEFFFLFWFILDYFIDTTFSIQEKTSALISVEIFHIQFGQNDAKLSMNVGFIYAIKRFDNVQCYC